MLRRRLLLAPQGRPGMRDLRHLLRRHLELLQLLHAPLLRCQGLLHVLNAPLRGLGLGLLCTPLGGLELLELLVRPPMGLLGPPVA
ncbi:MAG: hypothetical protein K2X43_04475 [Hyphomonadaceae bacterium]|jgi:hypothetical protein|nr:hypothetical protein [Hyphomonadaceae bacterium]